MHYKTPTKGQAAKIFQELYKKTTLQIQNEHQSSWMRLQGFFRQNLKIMLPYHLVSLSSTGLKSGYSGAKSLVKFILKQTVGNLPFGGTVTTIINTIYDIAEAGVSFATGIARNKLVANLAKKGFDAHDQRVVSQYFMHKYTAEQGVGNIKRCVAKARYAGQLVSKESVETTSCRQFFKAMHDLAWFEYRVNRLRGEIAVMQTYLDIMSEAADKAADAFQFEKDCLLGVAETLVTHPGWMDDAWHKECKGMCLRDWIRYRFFSELHLTTPKKAVPIPPSTPNKRPLPPRPSKKLPSLPPH
ncbi:MAG: hypothetical protein JW821_03630 [Deltaproteobacteria bacterium]|nr:hypothetical protein [Deltaproteobacteria bacterium]